MMTELFEEDDVPKADPVVVSVERLVGGLTDEEVWLRAWCACTTRPDVNGPTDIEWYADRCLVQFRRQFRKKVSN